MKIIFISPLLKFETRIEVRKHLNGNMSSSNGGTLNFGVLKVVSEARNAHGLRLQDPARYNAYCAKRILSLKKSLKFVQKSKKSPPKPVTEELAAQDARYPPVES